MSQPLRSFVVWLPLIAVVTVTAALSVGAIIWLTSHAALPAWAHRSFPQTIAAGLLFALLMTLWSKLFGGSGSQGPVTVGRVSEVISALRQTGKDKSFAVFMFTPATAVDVEDQAITLQVSLERGRLGFDWLLNTPRNVKDKEELVRFAHKQGYALAEREENGVKYLRTEQSGVEDLIKAIMRDLYVVPERKRLDLITEGFSWKK